MSKLAFAFLVVIIFAFILGFLIPPFLMFYGDTGDAVMLYNSYSLVCHQAIQRSFCVFSDGTVRDCIKPNVSIVPVENVNRPVKVITSDSLVGYKFGVGARCLPFYITFLIGILVYAYIYGTDSTYVPPLIILIISILPLAIDGTGQLFGFWESINIIRLITGSLAGFVSGFYVVGLINIFMSTGKAKRGSK